MPQPSALMDLARWLAVPKPHPHLSSQIYTWKYVMKNYLIAFEVLLLLTMTGCGQVVQGVIRDKPTGNPISSATVTIGEDSTTSNGMGIYKLDTSVEPSSTLIVNTPGYFMYSESVSNTLIHDIELVPRSGGFSK
jgi:hypothetical protein